MVNLMIDDEFDIKAQTFPSKETGRSAYLFMDKQRAQGKP